LVTTEGLNARHERRTRARFHGAWRWTQSEMVGCYTHLSVDHLRGMIAKLDFMPKPPTGVTSLGDVRREKAANADTDQDTEGHATERKAAKCLRARQDSNLSK